MEGLEEQRALFILPGKTKGSLSVVAWRDKEPAKNALKKKKKREQAALYLVWV